MDTFTNYASGTSVALLLVIMLVGCGNKGDLYRPEDVVKKAADIEQTSEEDQ